jgi:cytochrome c6
MVGRAEMKRVYSAFVQALFGVLVLFCPCMLTEAVGKMSPGEEAFERHCYVCHPKGGNVITPAKALKNKVLEENGVLTRDDIIRKMRNPGPGMRKFDEETIPDETAKAIAEYILKTFQ